MAGKYDSLKLENQLCFPLYACSKEIVRRYKTYLDKLDLTYTQYIVMMVMWEEKELNVKELGDKLFLDSGTLTPVLKKLEAKGYVTRERSKIDERTLIVTLTDSGKELREMAVDIPAGMRGCLKLSDEEMLQLRTMLGKILSDMGDVE
ncbi:MarR family winged helix-turn-helix transcriptional regulator [Lachnoanaerobaculum orale]|uniref:MarR family winged helix-turn-helix transcriptional regulator n=1 Tax=Lachnoanaerobaculum orale TaxID=979627 RepID=UPI0023A7967B|nr:MarR family transcriptional regulator [Lachnoanaerobaculum orale]